MFAELGGLKVFYRVVGRGEPVVIMHGWRSSIASFIPIFDCLSKNYQVYAFDFPGFGRSSHPTETWSTTDYGNFVLRFLQRMEIEETNIIAHSFGGRIAIWLAANFPERVKKLVLVDSAGIRPKRGLSYYAKVTIAKAGKRVLSLTFLGRYGEYLLEGLYRLVGSKDYQQESDIMRSTFVKIVNEDLKPLLPKIFAPTLLIWGGEDKDVPVSYAKVMEKEISGARLVVLNGAGHFSYLDRSSDFCQIVTDFFEDARCVKDNG